MSYLQILLRPGMPAISVIDAIHADTYSVDVLAKTSLFVSGFYDWIVRDDRLVGIYLFPLVESDTESFRALNIPYIFAMNLEVVIWFTPIHIGEALCVQDFNAQLVTSNDGELVLNASLWNVDDSIIAATVKALQAV